jgi:hypothetical protein
MMTFPFVLPLAFVVLQAAGMFAIVYWAVRLALRHEGRLPR